MLREAKQGIEQPEETRTRTSMISSDSCSRLVAGNYDVIVNEPSSFKSIISEFLQRFERHESELAQAENGYVREFKLLKEYSKALKEDKSNLIDGELEFNLRKNRYKDILPFNHTRVILSGQEQTPGSDYINANYIRGPSGCPRAYIACQGPLSCTLNDFWRMIWECGVLVVVMACNENESERPKCELYWPEQVDSSQCYGNIQVTLVKVRQICADFLIRKFSVKYLEASHSQESCKMEQITPTNNNNNNNNDYDTNNAYDNDSAYGQRDGRENACNGSNGVSQRRVVAERTICQFHYTTWPDHGVPDSVQPILELVRLVREVQPAEDKPILVHCSAGCGRTGTICCIDYVWGLLKRGKLDSCFDLFNIISELRQQRMSMVQTLQQYILCHRAVAALFMNQLKLMDNHTYENLDSIEDLTLDEIAYEDDDDEQDLGPVFI